MSSVPLDITPQATSAPSSGPAFIRLILWCVLTVAVPVVVLNKVLTGIGFKANRLFSDVLHQDITWKISELQKAKPEYVGIGNSMLYTRLGKTPEQMNALTGKKFYFDVKNASASAAWYMTLKNVVAASGVKPKAVFFFIRDNDITSPKFRTSGRSLEYINSLRGKHEPVLDEVLGAEPGGLGVVDAVSDWLNGPTGLFTFKNWEEKLPTRVTEVAMDIGGGGKPKLAQRAALTERFAIEHLRGDVAADMPVASTEGSKIDTYNNLSDNYGPDAEDKSFLPAMMEVARKNGIKLIFFRVKRRPSIIDDEPPEMRDYIPHLKHWIEERGGVFFDESYDPTIQLSDYLDGDHIRPERMAWYQEYFWKRMAGLFP